jgi:hypothetical protein
VEAGSRAIEVSCSLLLSWLPTPMEADQGGVGAVALHLGVDVDASGVSAVLRHVPAHLPQFAAAVGGRSARGAPDQIRTGDPRLERPTPVSVGRLCESESA